eukprot:11060859-Karenia_brevis.AAC.1
MHKNEEFLRAVFEVAAELGNVPIIVFGDVNVPPEQSAILEAAVSTGRWLDEELVQARLTRRHPRPTCFASAEGTRIDVAFWNSIS